MEAVEGYVGNFNITIRQKARYVDISKCTGCGECWNVCPLEENPSEFDYGMGMRPAIYIPFPQAVPARPVIDAKACAKLIRNGCGLCAKKCKAGAINFKDQDKLVEEKVGRRGGGHRLTSSTTSARSRTERTSTATANTATASTRT